MPHVFVNRPRLHDLVGDDPTRRSQFRWETINAVVYVLGGVLFIVGSVLFFPALEGRSDLGAWMFIVGSLMYLLVTGHDTAEVARYRSALAQEPTVWDRLETWAALSYVVGTVLFTIGSVLFLSAIDRNDAGAWCFVTGSLLFVLGATINVLQIVQSVDMQILQLSNLTALTFVSGSLLFTVASIPYLFDLRDAADERTIDGFLAGQYTIGSVLFLLGGLINYRRAYRVVARQLAASP